MEARAVQRYLRIAPRKMRLVADLVRGKRVEEALELLEYVPKRASRLVAKAIRSAVANAQNTQTVDVDRLYLKRITVDEGPTWQRFLPRAQGRATRIRKRTSHLTVVVDERG
ncbi:MAG: 50S ribosomal protein L22 [Candidatus Binatia bacterium]|nr:MAG: 50S ribosomal protein L22 [Candidatus Binatia bacterium]